MNNKKKKPHHELLHLLSANAIVTIVGFLNVIYITRSLNPAQFANFGLALSIFYFFAGVNAPLRRLLARFTPIYVANDKQNCIGTLLFKIWKWTAIGIFALTLLALVFNNFIVTSLKLPSIYFLLALPLFAGLNAFISAGRGIFNGLREYHKFNGSIYIETFVRLAFCIILFLFWKNASSAVNAYLAGSLFSAFFLWFWARPIIKNRSNNVDWKEVKLFILPLAVVTCSFILFNCIDTILSKAYLPGADAGNYAAALQLARVFKLIGGSFGIMMLPALSELVAKGLPTKKFMFKTVGSYALIMCIGLICIALLSNFTVKIVLGSQYVNSARLLFPLGLATGLMTITSLFGTYFLAIGIYKPFILPAIFVIIEAVAIWMFHTTSFQVAVDVLIVQSLLCFCMLICVFIIKDKHNKISTHGCSCKI